MTSEFCCDYAHIGPMITWNPSIGKMQCQNCKTIWFREVRKEQDESN